MASSHVIAPGVLLALVHCSSADEVTPGAADGDAAAPASSSSGGGSSGMSSSGGIALPDGSAPDAGGLDQTVADYVGVNGFIDDPIEKLAPIGVVREYHNWGWIADNFTGPAYPDATYTFMNFNGWDWDVFFAKLKAAGGSGFPAVQGSVPWMNDSAQPPVAAGSDATAAASYVAHADAMFQITARYGSHVVDDAALKLQSNPAQTRVSGLGTVEYFEDYNEQDLNHFSADAYAAMASADYDGDQGRLGATFGVKAADPAAKMVMGGLSGAYGNGAVWVTSITDYLDGVRAWSTAHRGGSFPADVINVHYYSFGPGGGQPALSPEDDGVETKLAAITAYRDANLPGKEVWWTEFGYDTNQGSVLRAPPLGGNSAEVVQGQWLVRELLAGLGAGIDRSTIYLLRDSDENDPTQFATCGLTKPKGDWTPKPSWFYVAAFRARLKSMHFAYKVPAADPDVLVYAFRDATSAGGAYVVWAKTSSAKVVPGYALAVPGAAHATAVTLADQQATGVEAALAPANGTVTLDVSETPTIVLVDAL